MKRATEPARLRHRQPAALRAGAADDVTERERIGRGKVCGGQTLIERLHRLGLHPAVQHVLIDCQPHRAVAVCLGEIGEHAHLPRVKSPSGSRAVTWQ